MSERENAAEAVSPSAPEDIPGPDEARDWLKESGRTPDLSVTWTVTDAAGSAERHLNLMNMLFGSAVPREAA